MVEGDDGFAFTPSRRQFYSRTLSRDLPSLSNDREDAKLYSNRNSWNASSSSDTLPRFSQTTRQNLPAEFSQEPTSRIAALYGNLNIRSSGNLDGTDSKERRPLSTGRNSSCSGEATGRVGGHCEQRDSNFAAPVASHSKQKDAPLQKSKEPMQQLKELVDELESINSDDLSEPPKPLRLHSPSIEINPRVTASKSSKSLSSFQRQQQKNQNNSNPNIMFTVALSRPEPKSETTSHCIPNSKSQTSLKPATEKIKSNLPSTNSFQSTFPTKISPHMEPEPLKKDSSYDIKSEETISKNIFIPYSPQNNSNSTSHKSFTSNKDNSQSKVSFIPVIDAKNEKDRIPNSSSFEKAKTETSRSSKTPSRDFGFSSSKLNKESMDNNRPIHVTMEPYRRGRSEDLRATIEIANAPESSKDGTRRGFVKPYRKSKSKDITPSIEAVGDKITQFNSSTLRRISPFEAYRLSKSRESESNNNDINKKDNRLKSPPPSEIVPKSSAAGMSQFEKAKTSIEKKFEKSKSPSLDRELGPTSKQIEDNAKASMKMTNSTIVIDIPNKETQKKVEKADKDLEKPKSVYKILTSKFSRSLSNVGEEKCDPGKQLARCSEEENGEKDEKFRLKRHSRFLRGRVEKSSSKNSVCDFEPKEDDEENKSERKSSTKLSQALNKFLGRKTEEDPKKVPPTKSTSAAILSDKIRPRPPRFRSKKLSKSQETLNQNGDKEEDERAKSVFPDTTKPAEVNLESATKDLCNHLSKIEINITSKIDNMSPKKETIPIMTTCNANLLTPEISSKRGSCSQHSPMKTTSPLLIPDHEVTTRKRSTGDCSEDGSITPTTESGNESTYSGMEDIKEMEDESVIDRITRKSYYSRFNETKRKPKPARVDTKEAIDQQLAAAKARLLQGEQQTNRKSIIRESMSPIKTTSGPTLMPLSDGVKKKTSSSRINSLLSSENDYCPTSIRNHAGFSPMFDDLKQRQYASENKEDSTFFSRPNLGTQDDKIYRRKSSTNLDDNGGYKRLIPSDKDDSQRYKRLSSSNLEENNLGLKRLSSVPRDNFVYKSLTSSLSLDNNQGYHTLQYRKPSLNDNRYNSPYNNLERNALASKTRKSNDPTIKSPSVSPSITLNLKIPQNDVDQEVDRGKAEAWEATTAADGEAVSSPNNTEDAFHRIPTQTSNKSSAEAAAVKSAREELSRRLTPLTRLSNLSSGATNAEGCKARPYRKTLTSGCLPLNQNDTDKKPSYKRTSTIDFPQADSRIRTTDYRRVLHDTARRFPGVRYVQEF